MKTEEKSPAGKRSVRRYLIVILGSLALILAFIVVFELQSGDICFSNKTADVKKQTSFPIAMSSPINTLAISPNGKVLAGGNEERGIILWETETGKELATLPDSQGPVVFSPDGKFVATGAHTPGKATITKIKLWDSPTGKEVKSLELENPGITDMAFSPDGKRIGFTGSLGSGGQIIDVASGQKVNNGNLSGSNIAFSPDGKFLAITSGKTGAFFDATTFQTVNRLNFSRVVMSVSLTFSPDGKILVGGGSGGIMLWKVSSGTELRKVELPSEGSRKILYTNDNEVLLSLNYNNGVDIINVCQGKPTGSISQATSKVQAIAISKDGRVMALAVSGTSQNSIEIWDVEVKS
jgi:WD40 repeat protein